MHKRKIFIEIPIPKQVSKRLALKVSTWKDLPVKWVKEKNLHITVSFVGYVDEMVLPEICQSVSDAAGEMESFDMELNLLELGPKKDAPQFVWAIGKASEELKKLNELVEKALGTFSKSHKEFRPHLTLGKIRKEKWQKLENKPEIAEKIHAVIPVDAIMVMESREDGSYGAIEECPLA